MDVRFIVRSLRMASALTALGYMLAVVYVNEIWALGFLAGSVWSIANLYLLKGLVERVITPQLGSIRSIVLYAALKFPLLYAAGYLILSFGSYDLWSLLVGFITPFVVIVLKAGGRMCLGIEGEGTGRGSVSSLGVPHS